MKKLKDLLNESAEMGRVYSNPFATAFVKENEEYEESEVGFSEEQRKAFFEAVKQYRTYGESVYRNAGLEEVYETIKNMVEVANKVTLSETGDWFDNVTVGRHMKRMGESFRVFEKTLKEVSTLQQRLEASYDEIGEVLGKYYEISELNEIEEGNEFGSARAKAIANGDSEFEVDGKTYKVTNVDKEDKENAEKFANESMKLTDMISVNEGNKPKFKVGDMVKYKGAKVSAKVLKVIPTNWENGYLIQFQDNKKKEEAGESSLVKESMNEGASTEEKRIVMLAVRKIAKYRNVPIDQSVVDVIRAAEELDRDIKKGKVKESIKEFNYPQSKMSNVFNLHFAQLTDKLPGMFYIVGRDVYHNDKKIVSLTGMDSVKSAVAKVKKKLGIKESMKLTDMIKKPSVNENAFAVIEKNIWTAIQMSKYADGDDYLQKMLFGRVKDSLIGNKHIVTKISNIKTKLGKGSSDITITAKVDVVLPDSEQKGTKTFKYTQSNSKFKAIIESVNEAGEFAGWIAGYNGKRVEIKKGEAKDLYNAKLLAIKKLKVPKSKVGLMFIKPAVDESVNEILVIVDKFDKRKQDYGKVYYKDGGKRPGDGDINKAKKELDKLSKKHKGLTLVSVGRNSKMYDVMNEAKYDIGMARKGNGLTIYNKAEEDGGDYKNIAHIDNKGNIKLYDKKLPTNIKKMIEKEAEKLKESINEGKEMIKLKNLLNESKLSDAWKKNNKRGKILKVGNVTLKSDGPRGIHSISKNGKKWGTFELDGNDWMVKPTYGKENWVDSIDDVIKIVNESVNESKSMKLTDMLNESIGIGELPSSKLMKMKVPAKDMLKSVNEAKLKKVTKQMWAKMDYDERVNALLTFFKDPDDAEEYGDSEWNNLPSGADGGMYIFE